MGNLKNITETNKANNEVAVFSFETDSIDKLGEEALRMIDQVYRYVSNKVPNLPDKYRRCDETTKATILSVISNDTMIPVWLELGEKRTPSEFHKHAGALHQVPWVIHAGNIYFFDFCNYFAKDISHIKTSVIVFPADKFCFKKMMDLTGSNYARILQIGKIQANSASANAENRKLDNMPAISENIYCDGQYNETEAEKFLNEYKLLPAEPSECYTLKSTK